MKYLLHSFLHKEQRRPSEWSQPWGLKASQPLPAALYERRELWGECDDVMGLFL